MPKKFDEPMKQIHVKMPESLLEKLDIYAKMSYKTRTDVIIEASAKLVEFIERHFDI